MALLAHLKKKGYTISYKNDDSHDNGNTGDELGG